ncbi:MAG: putative selenate reductase subunit YgfK [Bacteroidales bacterium]|nr:putative selenate reductase subunit YgfK [Bacteroidales bacterium]
MTTDKFSPIPASQLLKMILKEYHSKSSIFGMPKTLFYQPESYKSLSTSKFGHQLDNPVGVAAGPHTQLAQNIIAAWLMGARYIELKTIQTLDELEIAKPCIDMQDEGYNCEWSQELKIHESFSEYLNAWVIIHVLNHFLGHKKQPGTIFNMSVGYNLEGIMQPNVQWFFEKMNDCSQELQVLRNELKSIYPEITEVEIPSCISDNITLSTMHGCPANEIEAIAAYLMKEKKLHTFVKLNPTLLGPERLRSILNDKLGFKTNVPDEAFDHDLKFPDALKIIHSLTNTAEKEKLVFGLKLSNTLESLNHKSVFDGSVESMYMSGRALHPLTANLAALLQDSFDGSLNLSFSGGADAFNVSDLLACGFKTITVCSDLLKPGGYTRLNQYFEQLKTAFLLSGAKNIDQHIMHQAENKNIQKAAFSKLTDYAGKTLQNKAFHRQYLITPDIKTPRSLESFDCISAPCIDACATHQDIPGYLFHAANGNFDEAYRLILQTNPFPSITGMVCDHLCQNKCTRVHYDHSLRIREVKRFVSEQTERKIAAASSNGSKVAIIGSGPSGMSAAYYLALAGCSVDVFESKPKAGGMVQYAIPGFRLTEEAIEKDFKRVTDLGVKIHFGHLVDKQRFTELQQKFDAFFVGAGAQLSAPFKIEGMENASMLDSLGFLFNAKAGTNTGIGKHVVIIGGGNTAMDAARTAWRLVGKGGTVKVVYRRTINEMPADQGEIKAVLEEGIEIITLSAPLKIVAENGKILALRCNRMMLSGKDAKSRPMPVIIEGAEFDVPCDTIIPAVGQATDFDFFGQEDLQMKPGTYQTGIPKVFLGGDAKRGASTAINAIADGRKAAAEILEKAALKGKSPLSSNKKHDKEALMIARSNRIFGPDMHELSPDERCNFRLVSQTPSRSAILEEASRCLHCDEICNICTTVCPNFANYSYEILPVDFPLQRADKQADGSIKIEKDGHFAVRQTHQILNIANFCNECGNCNTFCPTNSAPYINKPKIHLTKESFDAAQSGYFLSFVGKTETMLSFKNDGLMCYFIETENEIIFENNDAIAFLSKNELEIKDIKFKSEVQFTFNTLEAATMKIILEGAKELTD